MSHVQLNLNILKRIIVESLLNRYDAYSDIANLEQYNHRHIDYGYLIIATDHEHYVNQSNYSAETETFDLRDGKKYVSGTKLIYRTDSKRSSITLINDYKFKWNILLIWGTNKNMYCIKINI